MADLNELWVVLDSEGLSEACEDEQSAKFWCDAWNNDPAVPFKPYRVQRFVPATSDMPEVPHG
jgi:hypothetical protein